MYVIVERYNAEMRGIFGYYRLAVNYNHLGYFRYLMEYSCYATLAGKYNSSTSKIAKKYKKGKIWSVPYVTSNGTIKEKRLVTLKDCKFNDCVDTIAVHKYAPNATNATIRARLQYGVCELCGKKSEQPCEVHLVPSLKSIDGKELWEQIMLKAIRKTLVVCEDCHRAMHTN